MINVILLCIDFSTALLSINSRAVDSHLAHVDYAVFRNGFCRIPIDSRRSPAYICIYWEAWRW